MGGEKLSARLTPISISMIKLQNTGLGKWVLWPTFPHICVYTYLSPYSFVFPCPCIYIYTYDGEHTREGVCVCVCAHERVCVYVSEPLNNTKSHAVAYSFFFGLEHLQIIKVSPLFLFALPTIYGLSAWVTTNANTKLYSWKHSTPPPLHITLNQVVKFYC